jgi:hypothetical protein
MSTFNQTLPLDLLALYKNQQVNNTSEFCDIAKQFVIEDLVAAYHKLCNSAPNRHENNKQYFVNHTGITSSKAHSNRREEHLAVALWNHSQEDGALVMPDGRNLRLLDYQFPLKARQSDKGVGKLDLFGLIDAKACVIELKIHPSGKGRSDTPLRAFLEALAYCAVVEANANDIAVEASKRFDQKFSAVQPALIVMAPEEYWSDYLGHQSAGDWWSMLQHLAAQLDIALGLESHFIVLRSSDFTLGLQGQKPQLNQDCTLVGLSDYIQQQ